jgi:hypothetical protein
MRQRSCLIRYASNWKVTLSTPDEVIGFINLTNPSSRITALGLIQSLTEISTRNVTAGKARLARKADNLAAICDPIF